MFDIVKILPSWCNLSKVGEYSPVFVNVPFKENYIILLILVVLLAITNTDFKLWNLLDLTEELFELQFRIFIRFKEINWV